MASKEPKKPRIPVAHDPDRLSVPAARLLDAIGSGLLCKEFVQDDRIPKGEAFFVEPGGRKAEYDAALELIRKRRFVPVSDGLFGGDSQTFIRAEALARQEQDRRMGRAG